MRKTFVSLLVFIIIVGMLGIIYKTIPNIFGSVVVPLPDQYRSTIQANAKRFQVDSCLIAAVINGESRWDPNAQSGSGAVGLMQLIGGTANAISRVYGLPYTSRDRRNPAASIAMGTALLRYNLNQYGSLRNALIAYNAGGAYAYEPDSALPRETAYYVIKINRYYDLYTSLYPDFCTGPSTHGNVSIPRQRGGGVSAPTPTPLPEFSPPPDTSAGDLDIDNFWKSLLTQQ